MNGNEIFARANKVLVGGGSAGQRVNKVLGRPLYIQSAKDARFIDADGQEWIDLHCAAGAQMFGWKNPRIEEAIQKCIKDGFYMNFDSEKTMELAERFTTLVPSVEKIRLVNSGTEATNAAIRVARAYTGKNLIIKFDGHFHGMHENVWYHGGYGDAYDANGEAVSKFDDCPGFPANGKDNVVCIEFNKIEAVKAALDKYADQAAALIVEPVNYDTGLVIPSKEYMQEMRELCTKAGVLLIYDEVISGVRFRPGSAQVFYDVKPDISTFAKAVANGFSIAIVGGKAEIMDMFNPIGPVVCSGTSSGNMMGVYAACECLKMASEPGFWDKIEHIEEKLVGGMQEVMNRNGVPGLIPSKGARFTFWTGDFTDKSQYEDIVSGRERYRADLQRKMVEEMYNEHLFLLYLDGIPHHGGFCAAHSDEDIAEILDRLDRVFKKVAPLV